MNENDIIYNAIENKKQKVIEEYENRLRKISCENNFAKVYYLLAETFENTMEQGEIGAEFLKKTLTNPFFKEANVDNQVNFIVFSNEDFEVKFSKSLSKEVIIKFKNSGIPKHYHDSINKSLLKLADLLEIYLNKKTFKNFKILANYNCEKQNKTIINKIRGYISTYKRCNKELLNKIRDIQEKDRLSKIEIERKNEEFEKKQIYAKKFLNSLTDLDKFKAAGWGITLKGILTEDGLISL